MLWAYPRVNSSLQWYCRGLKWIFLFTAQERKQSCSYNWNCLVEFYLLLITLLIYTIDKTPIQKITRFTFSQRILYENSTNLVPYWNFRLSLQLTRQKEPWKRNCNAFNCRDLTSYGNTKKRKPSATCQREKAACEMSIRKCYYWQ